jgi:hypothetical protein
VSSLLFSLFLPAHPPGEARVGFEVGIASAGGHGGTGDRVLGTSYSTPRLGTGSEETEEPLFMGHGEGPAGFGGLGDGLDDADGAAGFLGLEE